MFSPLPGKLPYPQNVLPPAWKDAASPKIFSPLRGEMPQAEGGARLHTDQATHPPRPTAPR